MMRQLPPIAGSNSVILPLLEAAVGGNRRNGDTLRQFSRSAMGLAGRSATEKSGAGDSSATESGSG